MNEPVIIRKGTQVTDNYTNQCYILNNKHDAKQLENTLKKHYKLLTLVKNKGIEGVQG